MALVSTLVFAVRAHVILILSLIIFLPNAIAADAYAHIPRLNFEFTLSATESALLIPGGGTRIERGSGDIGEKSTLSNLTIGENFGPDEFFIFMDVGPATAFAPPPLLPDFSLFLNNNVALLEFTSYAAPVNLIVTWDAIYSLITHETFSLAMALANVVESRDGIPDVIHPLFSNSVSNGGSTIDLPSGTFSVALPGGGIPVLLNLSATVVAEAAVPEPSSLALLSIAGFIIIIFMPTRTNWYLRRQGCSPLKSSLVRDSDEA